MTGLLRTSLLTSQKVDLAAAALAAQGAYGGMTELSREYSVSRPTIYSSADTAKTVLRQHFEAEERGLTPVNVLVDKAQLDRAIVALRSMAPNSVRAIENLLPILYPGVAPSYGVVQGIAFEACERAKIFNAKADQSTIQAGAVDEMFSQGDPVLAGVDLDTSYLFALSLRESRSGADWAEVLRAAQEQGLNLQVAVKDAALGIEAGVREVFPDAQQRDDCFHALYIMGTEQQRLERRGYGAITQVEEVLKALARCRATGRGDRHKLRGKLVKAKRRCEAALDLHDRFEQAGRRVQEALWYIDLEQGKLRSAAEMQAAIEAAAAEMLELPDSRSRKVGGYLKNRAPGLACYLEELHLYLDELAATRGQTAVRLACIIHRLQIEIHGRRCPWRRSENKRTLLGACLLLRRHAGDDAETVFEEVEIVLQHRHRASSAIEGFNAALRPYLYVHKGVNQEFLELFRAYYNTRTRRWGRHKGTSPHESMTGERVTDWLTMLGYPLSSLVH